VNNTKILFIFFFLIFIGAASAVTPPEPWPNEFNGDVSVNGEYISDREVIVFVGSEEEKRFTTNGSQYEVLVSGNEGESVEFYIENQTGGLTSAGTSITINEFGEERSIDLEFSVEDPESRVSTGEIVDTGEEYAVVEASANFLDQDGEVYVEYDQRETESKSISGSETLEFNLTDLEPDTEYKYQAFLDYGSNTINGSLEEVETDEIPGMEIIGNSNIDDGYVTAEIDRETIENTSISSDGDFRIDVPYDYSYEGEDVTVNLRGEEKYLEFESDENKEIKFNFSDIETEEEIQNPQETIEESSTQENTNDNSEEVEQSQKEENTNNTDIEEDRNMQQTQNTTDLEQNNSDNNSGSKQAITGEFFQQEVNGTTFVLLAGVIGLGAYIIRIK
jgi:hypothetical protein